MLIFLISELSDRFTKHKNNAFLLQAFLPTFCNNYSLDDLVNVFEMYGSILPGGQSATEAEFLLWKAKWTSMSLSSNDNDNMIPSNAFDAYESCPNFYPNIKLLLKILITLPVTTASAERTFSMLRRLKSWMRSTMGESRLTGLALMASATDVTISPDDVADKFLSMKRRILM